MQGNECQICLVVDSLVGGAAEPPVVPGPGRAKHAESLHVGAPPHAQHPGAHTRTLESGPGSLTHIMSQQHLACWDHCGIYISD